LAGKATDEDRKYTAVPKPFSNFLERHKWDWFFELFSLFDSFQQYLDGLANNLN
jgi:hypothetical protein